MTDTTPRLSLPLLQPGQAQKEMAHNEAIALIDVAVQGAAMDAGAENPPSIPEFGQCWILGDTPSGAWTGHAKAIACWTAAGWRFLIPREECDFGWTRIADLRAFQAANGGGGGPWKTNYRGCPSGWAPSRIYRGTDRGCDG